MQKNKIVAHAQREKAVSKNCPRKGETLDITKYFKSNILAISKELKETIFKNQREI